MKSLFLFVLITVYSLNLYAQGSELSLHTKNGAIHGQLMMPDTDEKPPVVLIIAGSGPTDMDGNNPMMKNNSLKMLAEGLFKEGIASVRYDKRGVASSTEAGIEERKLRFEDYVQDAIAWVEKLKKDGRFREIIVFGHSEGALIGTLTAQQGKVDKFISAAGAGQPADQIIRKQLEAQPLMVKDMSFPILDSLSAGKTVEQVNPMLASLFRPSVQPYLISWFQYDPQVEIAKLEIPVLIVQGSTDIQVNIDDAKLLAEGNKGAKLEIIEGMNHIFKEAPMDRAKNIASYSDPKLPIASALLSKLNEFIRK